MDYPFGHHHHHHHGRPEEDPNQNPYPNPNPYADPNQYPPPAREPYGYQPPPPPSQPFYGGSHVQHVGHEYGRPDNYAPPPPHVQHVGHEVGPGGGYGGGYGYENQEPQRHHEHRPGFSPPPMVEHVSHVSHGSGIGEVTRQPTVRVYTKAAENYSLSIREGKVVLVPANPRDEYQVDF